MPWYDRWRNVFRSEQINSEIEDEFQHHLAQSVDDLVARGMSEADAWSAARKKLGNYSLQKESTRDMDISVWLDSVRADLAYGIRQWRANPGFAAVAILSLALGIGANAAIFRLVNAIRIQMLPVKSPGELVSLEFEKPDTRPGNWYNGVASSTYPLWKYIQTQQQAFSGMVAWAPGRFNLAPGGEPRFVNSIYVSGNYFSVLGVGAFIGRALSSEDDNPACSPAAMISYTYWQHEFTGSADVLSRSISYHGVSIPIVGVTPPSFFGVEVGRNFDIAVPLCMDAAFSSDHRGRLAKQDGYWLVLMGRLKPGWTVARATAHLHAISPAVMQATLPATYAASDAKGYLTNRLRAEDASTGISRLRFDYERPLWLLMAATGLIVLIACANLANLLLARATAREPEIAVRLALGASRGRLIRQLLVESLLLAVAGTLAGSVLAHVLSRGLVAFISPPGNPLFVDFHSDVNLLLYSSVLAVLTCILFGLGPAMRASYLSPVSAMRGSGRGVTSGRDRFTLRRALVAAQVAFSLVLLFGALLFTGTFHNLLTTDPGFQSEGVIIASIGLEKTSYAPERIGSVYQDIRERLSALPGVVSAAQVEVTPLSGSSSNGHVGADSATAEGSGILSFFNRVTPGYFRTMDIPLIAGRDFDQHDRVGSPKVAMVNEAFAHKFFPGKDAIGHTFHRAADAGEAEPSFLIVGLVGNTKYRNIREALGPVAYFPSAQDDDPGDQTTFAIRISGAPGAFTAAAKSAIASINPRIGVAFRPLSEQMRESLLRASLMATLSGSFGFLAAALAALGLYGVIAYMIAQRANEIGVRIALGADRAKVIGMVLREAIILLVIGIAIGIGFAWWAGRTAESLLFGMEPNDSRFLLGAAVLLTTIGLIASYVPARRAGAMDPAEALRSA